MHDYACNYTCTYGRLAIDRPWEDDVIYENTMDFDGHDNEGIFIDAGPQL
jgi:hypothetical protein